MNGMHKIHTNEFHILAIFAEYLRRTEREHVAMETFVDWSGRRFRWHKKVRYRLEGCIVLGAIERRRAGPGMGLFMTQKGQAILDSFDAVCDQVAATMTMPRAAERAMLAERQRRWRAKQKERALQAA